MPETPVVVQVRQIIERRVEVGVVVIVAVEKAEWDVERSRHADGVGDQVGMAEREVDGVISAEAAARCADLAMPSTITDKRRNLIDKVGVVGVLAMQAVGRM